MAGSRAPKTPRRYGARKCQRGPITSGKIIAPHQPARILHDLRIGSQAAQRIVRLQDGRGRSGCSADTVPNDLIAPDLKALGAEMQGKTMARSICSIS